MTIEETRALIKQAQEGSKEAMEELVLANIKLLQTIVNKYKHTYHDPEDLFQLASIGLIKAVHGFDLTSTNKLSTYAYPLIHREIYNFLRVEGVIRTPRPIQKVERLINNSNLVGKTPEEISEIIGIADLALIKETLTYIERGKVLSLNKVVYEDEKSEITLEDMVQGDLNGEWANSVLLRDAIKTLDEREKQIIHMRYEQDMTQREVANALNISQVQISRIERRLFQKLRGYMGMSLELPKAEKPKVEEIKTAPKELRGDRDNAIHLLKTSTLSYNDIAAMTGVPFGTMCKLGKKHRPQFIIDIIKKRSVKTRGELNVFEEGIG